MAATIIPVILSGGSGTRLWPVSRKSFPKQFWPLVAEHTLIQQTVLRGVTLADGVPLIICNAAHRFVVAEQLRQIDVKAATIMLEPEGRNSAPAIAAAACLIAEKAPEAIMWVMAADALVNDLASLKLSLNAAVRAAQSGYIATFGIAPDRPETGYGYIEKAEILPLDGIANAQDVYRVKRFVEKPDLATATSFVASGAMLWNSGMFVARASTFIEETKRHAPDLWRCVSNSVSNRKRDLDFERLEAKSFSQAPAISVDYAIAEKTDRAAVVQSHFSWSDIGSWDAVWNASNRDESGNAANGDVLLQNTRNCFVRSDGPLVTLRGMQDIIVVATDDAVMITQRCDSQEISQIVHALEVAGHRSATQHKRCYRPWGHYVSLAKGEAFQVKQITVLAHAKLSLQRHRYRAEHWVVVSGEATVTRGADIMQLKANESIYIPVGCAHRLENCGYVPLVVIEVQTGTYLEEDDIERLDDVYARVSQTPRG